MIFSSKTKEMGWAGFVTPESLGSPAWTLPARRILVALIQPALSRKPSTRAIELSPLDLAAVPPPLRFAERAQRHRHRQQRPAASPSDSPLVQVSASLLLHPHAIPAFRHCADSPLLLRLLPRRPRRPSTPFQSRKIHFISKSAQ